MRKLLVMPICLLSMHMALSQDSTAAVYIEKLVQRIESQIHVAILEKQDTAIYDADDSTFKGEPLRVRTEFYTNPRTMQLEKVVEKSRYKRCTTEITVYYQAYQPIRFTSMQWNDTTLKADFDVYYMNGTYMHCLNRVGKNKEPDSYEFLRWCRDFVVAYKKIVSEYDKTYGKLR